jgi:polyhydroxyalkanoate synthesis regulator phasin
MTETSSSQQLFDMWKRQLEEGAASWAQLMTKGAAPAPPDPAGFWWKPMFEQGLAQWARIFAQTPVTPELSTQWKQFLDQSIEAWSKALSQAMSTEAFAQMMGKTLDQWLVSQGPAKRAAEQSVEAALQAFNLPSRTQVTAVAKQIVELEERLDRLEDGIATLARRLEDVLRSAGGGGAAR